MILENHLIHICLNFQCVLIGFTFIFVYVHAHVHALAHTHMYAPMEARKGVGCLCVEFRGCCKSPSVDAGDQIWTLQKHQVLLTTELVLQLSFYLNFFETGSHVTQAGFEFTRLTLKSSCSSLSFSSAGIANVLTAATFMVAKTKTKHCIKFLYSKSNNSSLIRLWTLTPN